MSFGLVMPEDQDEKLKIQVVVLEYLRIYMAATTIKNPLSMIDDFIERLEHDEFEGCF